MDNPADSYSTPFSHFQVQAKNGNADGQDNYENRGRSHTDSAILHFISPLDGQTQSEMETVPIHKQRLYKLFTLIEKEMDALYLENSELRQRLGISGKTTNKQAPEAETPIRRDFGAQMNETIQSVTSELEPKSSIGGKKAQSRQHKWKSAFKNPSGKLALKVGANFPESKHKFVQSFKGHTDGVWQVCTAQISATNHIFASASADQTSKIWLADKTTQPLVSYVGHTGSINSVAIRPESNRTFSALYGNYITILTCSGDRSAHIWRVNLQEILDKRKDKLQENNEEVVHQIHQPLLKLNGHSDAVMSGDWLIGGEQVITVSWDRTANLFDAESGKILKVLSGHDQELTSCSSHPTQKLLATASKDFTFRLWDFREPIHSVAVFQGHNDAVTSVLFSTLHHIISGSDDRTVKVWDLRNMRSPSNAIRLDSAANRIAICNNRNLLAIPLDNRNISVYDLNGNRQARIPRSTGKCHHRLVSSCAWLNDHPINNLITCGFDKQIIGWRVHLPSSAGTRN